MPGADSAVTCLAYAADGQTLAAGHADGRIEVWHVEDWQ
jgi:WD40 repeat protein